MDTLIPILIPTCYPKLSRTLALTDQRLRMVLEVEIPTKKLQQLKIHHHLKYPKRLMVHPSYLHT